MPVVLGTLGVLYAAAAALLGGRFLWLAVDLMQAPDMPAARRTFLFSLLYLARCSWPWRSIARCSARRSAMASLDDVDLLDHDLFAAREPWDVFERLRHDAPVYWHDEPGGRGFWNVTRYDDVVAVLKDTDTYSSELGGVAQIEDMREDELEARRNFMETDPPRHTQWRRLFARDFAPRSLEKYEPFLRDLTRGLLDETLPLGEFDFVERIAAPIPIRVLGHVLGVPEEHLDRLVELGDAMLVDTDPELARVVAGSAEHQDYRLEPFGSPDAAELCAIGRGIYANRREHPQDDILSLVAHAKIDGCPLESARSTTRSRSWSSPATRPPGRRWRSACSRSCASPTSWTCCARARSTGAGPSTS